jgi:hypothetical protein
MCGALPPRAPSNPCDGILLRWENPLNFVLLKQGWWTFRCFAPPTLFQCGPGGYTWDLLLWHIFIVLQPLIYMRHDRRLLWFWFMYSSGENNCNKVHRKVTMALCFLNSILFLIWLTIQSNRELSYTTDEAWWTTEISSGFTKTCNHPYQPKSQSVAWVRHLCIKGLGLFVMICTVVIHEFNIFTPIY